MLEELKHLFDGKRIRYEDTHLVARCRWHVFFAALIPGIILRCIWLIRKAPGEHTAWFLIFFKVKWWVYLIWIVSAVLVMLVVCLAYESFFPDAYLKLQHRQKIAELFVRNRWYETEQGGRSKPIVELPEILRNEDGKERVSYFPKIRYKMKNGAVILTVEVASGNFQKSLLGLEEQVEPLLFAELIDKELQKFYMRYTFSVSVMADRIPIEDVRVEHGSIRLMKNLWWEFDTLPHALIIGGTGGGKTYFILTLIEALLKSGAVLSVLDPKRSDLADLAECMPNVYYELEDMSAELERFYNAMMARTNEMKLHPDYVTGKNYAYLGLEPHFLIFDEYVAYMEMLGREREKILSYMKKIVMLGRQVGYFIILACQRPDAKYFADGMRDQFHLRIALGKNSEMGYGMVFGTETKKLFVEKKIKGRGYIDVGTGTIREFYSPLVPGNYNFLENIRQIGLGPTVSKPPEPEPEEEDIFADFY